MTNSEFHRVATEFSNAAFADLVTEIVHLRKRLRQLEPFLASPDGYVMCHHCKDWHQLTEAHLIPVVDPEERV